MAYEKGLGTEGQVRDTETCTTKETDLTGPKRKYRSLEDLQELYKFNKEGFDKSKGYSKTTIENNTVVK